MLFLRDPVTGIQVEGESPWSMKEAVAALTNKIVEEKGVTVHSVLFQPTPFEILEVVAL